MGTCNNLFSLYLLKIVFNFLNFYYFLEFWILRPTLTKPDSPETQWRVSTSARFQLLQRFFDSKEIFNYSYTLYKTVSNSKIGNRILQNSTQKCQKNSFFFRNLLSLKLNLQNLLIESGRSGLELKVVR